MVSPRPETGFDPDIGPDLRSFEFRTLPPGPESALKSAPGETTDTTPLPHHGVMESLNIRPGHLTAHQTARVLGITLGGVRLLVHRGQLTRSGGTPRQPWYAAEAVAALAASRAAREAA